MASIWKHPKSGFWFACITRRDGTRTKLSTKIPIRKPSGENRTAAELREAALVYAKEIEALERGGTDIELQAQKIVRSVVTRATGKPAQFYSAKAWIDLWIKNQSEVIAATTLTRYTGCLREFIQSLEKKANMDIGAVTKDDVVSFREAMSQRGLAPRSIRVALKVIKMVFASALREGRIERDPAANVKIAGGRIKSKNESERRDYFKPEQISALLEVARGTDWEGVILVGATHGFRLSDCLSIEWSDMDLGHGIWVGRVAQKTGFDHGGFPIHRTFLEWLKTRHKHSSQTKIFPNLAGIAIGGANGASSRFRKLMTKAGIVPRKIREGQGDGRTTFSLGFHSLRHSAASLLKMAGVDDADIQRITGHSDPKSLQIYTHRDLEHWREVLHKNTL